jgi:hypothetical protein
MHPLQPLHADHLPGHPLRADRTGHQRQCVPTAALKENNLSFDASGHETIVPATVALTMTILALTATKSVQAAFARKGDPMLRCIDVPALPYRGSVTTPCPPAAQSAAYTVGVPRFSCACRAGSR